MNSDTNTHIHTHLSLACALTLLSSCKRERGGKQSCRNRAVGSVAAILLQSVCTHTSVQVGEKEREEGERE